MSHPLLIFLFLKAFERVTGLFQIFTGLFFSNLFVNHKFTSVFFCRGIPDFSEKFWFLLRWERRGISWLVFFFYRVNQVNSEYQPSHPSPTNSRPSLSINLYLVSDSSRPVSRRIRLGRVIPDSADFLNPVWRSSWKRLTGTKAKRSLVLLLMCV